MKQHDEKTRNVSYRIFSTFNSLSLQFVNASTDIPIEKSRRVGGFGRYRENDRTEIYRRLILAPKASIFSIHVTPHATEPVTNIYSVFPTYFQQIIRTQRKTSWTRSS